MLFAKRFTYPFYKEQRGLSLVFNALDTHDSLYFGGTTALFDPYRTAYATEFFG